MKLNLISLAVAACFAFGGSSAFAAMSKGDYKAEQNKIEATYKADKKACGTAKGNAKDICKAEAKGKERVAKAELEAGYMPSPKADRKAKMARADAEYDVAKEKCDDLKGNQKDVCVKDAKAAHVAAKGQAKTAQVAAEKGAGSPAAVSKAKDAKEDTNDARYSAAKERCESLKGDVKDKCQLDAKKQFGKT